MQILGPGVAEGSLPSPRGVRGQKSRASPLEGSFHKEGTACSVSLCEKHSGDGCGERLGLGFGKQKAVLLGHDVVFAGRGKGWPILTWFGLSVCTCMCMCAYVLACAVCA